MMKKLIYILFVTLFFGCNSHHKNSFYNWKKGKNKVTEKHQENKSIELDEAIANYTDKITDSDTNLVENTVLLVDEKEINEENKYKKSEKQLKKEKRNKQLTITKNKLYKRVKKGIILEESRRAETVIVEKYGLTNSVEEVKNNAQAEPKENGFANAFIIILLILLVLLLIIVGYIIFLFYSFLNGCYVATMVYGSYDDPKVLILRKFRDGFLQKSILGRTFIIWYYALSPLFVEKHQSKKWMTKIIRGFLNVFVFLISPFYKD